MHWSEERSKNEKNNHQSEKVEESKKNYLLC
jgi:hypothetical protein